jgi:glyoxylase-like metal-dependent hydrolase (beta-lactamase superfamily II)
VSPPELVRVTEAITCVRRRSYFTCSYVVRDAGGVALVDAGARRGRPPRHRRRRRGRGFVVVATPGHTPGHVAYYHRQTGAVFAGDALAVVNGDVRRMARPVTPDLPAARASMVEVLSRHPVDVLCPGHRAPLVNARAGCERALARLAAGEPWPLFG